MAILQSCCFWRSVRKGSYASAIYTAAYFGVIVAVMSTFVDEERRYYFSEEEGEEFGVDGEGGEAAADKGDRRGEGGPGGEGKGGTPNRTATPRRPMTQSFLEPEGISETTMYFNIVVLACASCGFIASLLLCCGLYIDNRLLLVPWILIVVLTSLVDLMHILYLMVLESMKFNPLTSIVFTIDFFLLSINVYCLLCVVSQYQEYKAGRGTAQYEDFTGRLPVIRYEAPQGATSIMSSKRTMPSTLPATSTPAVSPTGLSILLPGGEGHTSAAAAAAAAAIAAEEAREAAEMAALDGGGVVAAEGGSAGTMIGTAQGGEEGGGGGGEEGGGARSGERWRRKRRPPKRVQFPEEGGGKAGCGREAEEKEEAEAGQGGGPFILEGGHWSVGEPVAQSAMLLLSSSSVTAAAAVVVATDTAPLLSPKPPFDPSPHVPQTSTRMTFFGGSGGSGGRSSHVVDS